MSLTCATIALTLSFASQHLTDDFVPAGMNSYNEVNPGVSFECGLNSVLEAEVGAYLNSIGNTSFHTGIILKKDLNKDWRIGTNFGIVSGYEVDAAVVPFIRPFVQYKMLRVGIIPRYRYNDTDGADAVITFELSIQRGGR